MPAGKTRDQAFQRGAPVTVQATQVKLGGELARRAIEPQPGSPGGERGANRPVEP